MERRKKNGLSALTEREQEILQLIWNGLKNREIGNRLKISVKTVEAHRAEVMRRLGTRNLAGLVHYAVSVGLVPVDQ